MNGATSNREESPSNPVRGMSPGEADLEPPVPGTPAPPVPPAIPDHQLLRCIGRGSYGEVWLARNVLGELRAVKIIHRRAFGDNRPFDREFQGIQRYEPISRSHESQVQILHVGRNDAAGYFYYVMELADGAAEPQRSDAPTAATHPSRTPALHDSASYTPRTLRSELERHGRLPIAQCLDIGLALTTALEHLHGRGLVHRDIKPSNIIFVRGQPKLADIGLVTDAGDAASIVGTEGYLAPEGPGSPQADLYSLGKVLYEISTGRDRRHFPDLPVDLQPQRLSSLLKVGSSALGVERSTSNAQRSRDESRSGDSKPNHNQEDILDPKASLELNEILLQACAHDARQRYQSAAALRADLELLRRGQSVRRKRTIKRRWAAMKTVGLLAALIALMAFGVFSLRQSVNRNQAGGAGGTIQPEMKGTQKREAWNAYLNGLHYYKRDTPDDSNRAIGYLKEAVSLDPKFAQPYAALAEIYRWRYDLFPSDREAMTKAKEAALQALALDDSLAQAHKELGYVAANLDRDFAKAERELRRAIALSTDYATGHAVYAWILLEMGRLDEAKREIKLCLRLDPVFTRARYTASVIFLAAGELEEAIGQLRKALDLDPNYRYAFVQLGEIHEDKEEFPQAIEMFRKAAIADGHQPGEAAQTSEALLRAFATGGARGYWRRKLELADVRSTSRGELYDIAVIHLHLGEIDAAFEFLEKLEALKSRQAFKINYDRRFDGVRSDPRFQALLRKLGLDTSLKG